MNISHYTFGPSAGSEAQHHASQAQVRQQERRRAAAQRKARRSRVEQRERDMLARQRAAQQQEQEQYLLQLQTLHATALEQVEQAQERTDIARQAAEVREAAARAREAESRAHIAERFAAAVGQVREERRCTLQRREFRKQCMVRARKVESQRTAARAGILDKVRAVRAAQARRARNITGSNINSETQRCDPCAVQGVPEQEAAMGQSRAKIDKSSVEAQQKQKAAERGQLALCKLRQGRRLRQLSTELQRAEQANMAFKAQHTPAAQPKESSLTARCKPGDSQNKLTARGQHILLPHQAPLEVIAQTQWKLKSGPPCLAGSPRAHARDPLHCSMAASPKNEHAMAADGRPGLATQGHCIACAHTPKPAPAPVQSEACQSPKRASRSSAAFRAPRSGLSAKPASPLGSSTAPKQPFKTASSTRQMTNSQPAAPIEGRSAFHNIASALCSPGREGFSSKLGKKSTILSSTRPPSTRLQTATQSQQPAHPRKPYAGLRKTGAKWSRNSHHAAKDLPWPALSPTQICVALPDEMPRTACEVQPYPTPMAAAAAAVSVVTGHKIGQCQRTGLPQVIGSVALSTGRVPTECQTQEACEEEADQAHLVLELREASSVFNTGHMTGSDGMLPVQCKPENMLNTAPGDGGNHLLHSAAEELQAACMRLLQDLSVPGNAQGISVLSEMDELVMHGAGGDKLAVLVSQLEADLAVMG